MKRRQVLGAITAAGLGITGVAVTGCASDDTGADPGGSGGGGAFPVTVDHVFGTTEIPEKPSRVATIGWMTQDLVAALGIVPIAVPELWGAGENKMLPWFADKVAELGGELPEVLRVDDDNVPDYEQILGLEPDVILAPHSGLTEPQYERLSQIAPTVAYAEKPWMSGNWRDLMTVVGKALGEDQQAADRIADTQAAIDEQKAKYPQFAGASYLFGATVFEGDSQLYFYVKDDPRPNYMRELGFVDSPSLSELQLPSEDSFTGTVSLERISEMTADVYLAWSNDAAATQRTLDDPLASRWDPIAEGRYFIMEDATMGMALSGATVLSIPWGFANGMCEAIAKALEGEPTVMPARSGS